VSRKKYWAITKSWNAF